MAEYTTWQLKLARVALLHFEGRIKEIDAIIDEPGPLPSDSVDKARRLYKALKADMKEIADCYSGADDSDEASQVESQYLIPAIHGACNQLLAATNSHPKSSNWGTELYAASVDLSHMRNQIEEVLGMPSATHR